MLISCNVGSYYLRWKHLCCALCFNRHSLFMLFLSRNWWSECDDKLRNLKKGLIDSQFALSLSVLSSLNVDCGLVKKHPWIGNSRVGVVLGIHSVIAMGYWWATFLFVKLISHILLCMFVCSKIRVPLGICWLCVNPGCFIPMLVLCGMWGLSAFMFFMWVLGKTFCVEGRLLVSHIENKLKWPMVLMKVRSKWFDPKRLVVFN